MQHVRCTATLQATVRPADGRKRRASTWIERGLRLAAAPTFAVAGLGTALATRDAATAWCGAGPTGTGMVAMYASMSVFHLPPWIRWFRARTRAIGVEARRAEPERRLD